MVDKLKFFDVKAKKKFSTDKFEIKIRDVKGNKRKFAVAESPFNKGMKSWRVLPKDFKK